MRDLFFWAAMCCQGACSCLLSGQAVQAAGAGQAELRVVWYNVENLFYPEDDSLPGDDEFTPDGLRHWTWSRYRLKLTLLSKVIIASGRGVPPAVVGLCEVEDARVLADLAGHPILAPYQYAFLHIDGPDPRGMDVACLYRPELAGLTGWSVIPSAAVGEGTRDMLQVTFSFGPGDTLGLFLVHLVSKYRGAGATAESRREQAGHLIHCMDSVHSLRPATPLVAAGDFNDAPGAYSLQPMIAGRAGAGGPDRLVPEVPLPLGGTYKYRGTWSQLDQAYVYQGARKIDVSARILALPPLIVKDEIYGGVKPRRTYEGYQYQGGLSDHLPLVLLIRPALASIPAEQ